MPVVFSPGEPETRPLDPTATVYTTAQRVADLLDIGPQEAVLMSADGDAGAVYITGTDFRNHGFTVGESDGLTFDVVAMTFVLEMDGDVGKLFHSVHEKTVQISARDGVDHFLVVLAVGNKCCLTAHVVKHTTLHGDGDLKNPLFQPHPVHSLKATIGDNEIDGTPGGDIGSTHVRTALVEGHLISGLPQVERGESSHQATSYNLDSRCLHLATSDLKIWAKRYTSSKLL